MFAKKVLRPNDSILCLNYDCYLEGALDYYGVWTPNGGYHVNYPDVRGIVPNPNNIKIYKIHGSENFRQAPFIDDPHTHINFIINESIFPASGLRKNLNYGGPNSKAYIIAPSFVKIPHVTISYIMISLLPIAKSAKNLIIIGCGMRPEDGFLSLILTRFLYGVPKDTRKKLAVHSPSSEGILKRIRGYCAPGIDKLVDIVSIPSGIEDGIDDLIKAIAD